ncbi:MAG: Nif3-like dinuclear metal center hexameric protein [Bacteroidetes bacterium]|nr:Nif3-like dinuclear metal center hexameric protein [Bacteroidota bacterium]
MKIGAVISALEELAHPSLQEGYDNAGLLTGTPEWDCTGIICTLDATPEVVQDAIAQNCNLIVAHHPIIFSGLKKINGKNYIEQTIIAAIKNDIAIYAIHTNLDNVIHGVNGRIARLLGLNRVSILAPKENTLYKLYTFVPADKAADVRQALFAAGGGHIGNYSECSFNAEGKGTFKAGNDTSPYVGTIGQLHEEPEIKIELVFPPSLRGRIVAALKQAHPYEEVAYDIVSLQNPHPGQGAGIVGELESPMDERALLGYLKKIFQVPVIRHTAFLNRPVKRVALCGGAGSFLISKALASGADMYITADMKYHEFFDANGRILIADIGHYESEQFTTDLLQELLAQKFPTFAVLKTRVKTNPVQYF